jgi:transcriptional regulator with XRE-family HTH domain
VIFCDLDNGRTYPMPLCALEQAEDWDPKAKPKRVRIVHDGFAAIVEFDTNRKIDFPADFVLHICEPAYAWHKDKARAASGVGDRIREIREMRGLTLDALAAKCGIAKPNLSRLENGNVTPQIATINTVAAALRVHPALLVTRDAWTWTLHEFVQWKQDLRWKESEREPSVDVKTADLVKTFLALCPEHKYARLKLLRYANPDGGDVGGYSLNANKWRSVSALRARSK